jgi:NAD+ diphosphatase
MIQDIMPKQLYNQYRTKKPQDLDTVFYFKGTTVMAKQIENELVYPTYVEFKESKELTYIYLFSIDDNRYFLAKDSVAIEQGKFSSESLDAKVHDEYVAVIDGYEFVGINSFRLARPRSTAFAAITAYHLYVWYRDNRFCGRCGGIMVEDHKERMLKCNHCNNMVFPKISPAVIVGVMNGDKILLTKYTGRTYKNYALVAGFTEIGETAEQTVMREVMEETGLKVKNIRYYKSQPWAPSQSLLMGFFCDLDGSDKVQLDPNELAVGEWFAASDIDVDDDGISLTREMMLKFKKDVQEKGRVDL